MFCNGNLHWVILIKIKLVYKKHITGQGPSNEYLRPTLKVFLFPLTRPCFSGMVGRKTIFLTSQIPYPLNLIVNSPNIGNKTKCTNDAN